ncbi:MAG: hypothetical protein OXC18_14755 [Desulfurellaceae bacterium]|nr:hypothetical protein [Desulfurellaceae bacterium]
MPEEALNKQLAEQEQEIARLKGKGDGLEIILRTILLRLRPTDRTLDELRFQIATLGTNAEGDQAQSFLAGFQDAKQTVDGFIGVLLDGDTLH